MISICHDHGNHYSRAERRAQERSCALLKDAEDLEGNRKQGI